MFTFRLVPRYLLQAIRMGRVWGVVAMVALGWAVWHFGGGADIDTDALFGKKSTQGTTKVIPGPGGAPAVATGPVNLSQDKRYETAQLNLADARSAVSGISSADSHSAILKARTAADQACAKVTADAAYLTGLGNADASALAADGRSTCSRDRAMEIARTCLSVLSSKPAEKAQLCSLGRSALASVPADELGVSSLKDDYASNCN